jgi:transcriptional regulator of acetoin/glycerol metabolism
MHNVLRTALALLGDGHEITVDELSEDFVEQAGCGASGVNMRRKASAVSTRDELLADVEAKCISSTLERTGGNIAAAARMMGISRNTLYRKLRGHTVGSP